MTIPMHESGKFHLNLLRRYADGIEIGENYRPEYVAMDLRCAAEWIERAVLQFPPPPAPPPDTNASPRHANERGGASEIDRLGVPEGIHLSWCAVHNAPAYSPGPCNCGADDGGGSMIDFRPPIGSPGPRER